MKRIDSALDTRSAEFRANRQHNLALAETLRRLLAHPAFVAAQIHTGFLDAHPDVAAEPAIEPATLHKLLAVAALSSRPLRDAADAVPALHAAIGAWRN